MATLACGVLVKLLDDMLANGYGPEDRKPAMLQIRSIIPVLAEGDLWPNKGFYLKVCDASHAMYVSLPQEQDELILCNKLQIGQLIYVDKLEAGCPVPLLIGTRPVPGRFLTNVATKDLDSEDNLVEIHRVSDSRSMKEKAADLENRPMQKFSSSVAPKPSVVRKIGARTTRRCCIERKLSDSNVLDVLGKGSDSSSTLSAPPITKRRSWSGVDINKMQDMRNSRMLKSKPKPSIRSPASSVSPLSRQLESSSDKSTPEPLTKDIALDTESIKSLKSRSNGTPKRGNMTADQAALLSTALNRTRVEDRISWNSLPSPLMKLGKEVLKQRDMAFLASMEALQEAYAAEQVLNCLSSYSEIRSEDAEDPKTSVDKFFGLHDDLAHSRLILQSLSNISSPKALESDSNSPDSTKELRKLALDQRKHAFFWIKAALASDLIPFLNTPKPSSPKLGATSPIKRPSAGADDAILKSSSTLERLNKNPETQLSLTSDVNKHEWTRGVSLYATSDLANSLQSECRTLFLDHVEHYIDGLENNFSMESDQVIGMMLRIKKVSEWLDVMIKKEAGYHKIKSKEGCEFDESRFETYGRVKDKIYRTLLRHIEKTATAWGNKTSNLLSPTIEEVN